MSKRSIAQLKTLTDQVIKTNNSEQITAAKDNPLRKDFIDSFLNLVDGGLLLENEAGYKDFFRPTSPGSFATVDMIGDVDLSQYIRLDGTSDATTDFLKIGNFKGIQFEDGIDYAAVALSNSIGVQLNTSNSIEFRSDLGYYKFRNTTNKFGTFDFSALTDDRVIVWQDKDYTGVADLSDIELYFLGVYTSLSNLQAAHPTATSGEYAIVDSGAGSSAIQYIWDTDEGWVRGDGTGGVLSFNGRIGTVMPQIGDYSFSQISGTLNLATQVTGSLADANISSASNWNAAYTNRITSLTTTGSSGSASLASNILNIPTYTLSGLGGIGLTSLSGTGGVSYNNTTGAISFNLATGNTWTAKQTAPAWIANGTGGAGYIQVANQSSMPAAVSGNLIISSDNLNRLTLIRRNIANSADITRTLSFPDASYIWTYPTPASGTTSTLASLETAQTFTQTNRFPTIEATTLSIMDFADGTWKNALTSDATTMLRLGAGWAGVNVTPATTFSLNVTVNGNVLCNTIRNRQTGTSLQLTTNAGSGAASPNVVINTGTVTGSFTSGSILMDPGTSSIFGGLAFFNTGVVPTWNSLQKGIFVGTATAAATGNPTSGYYNWAFDDGSGSNVVPWFRTTGGNIIKLAQQTTAVATIARVGLTGNSVFDASTFGGYTIGQIVQALKNIGLLA